MSVNTEELRKKMIEHLARRYADDIIELVQAGDPAGREIIESMLTGDDGFRTFRDVSTTEIASLLKFQMEQDE